MVRTHKGGRGFSEKHRFAYKGEELPPMRTYSIRLMHCTYPHQNYKRFFANILQPSRCVKESSMEKDRRPINSVVGRCKKTRED